jgi:preprotein translocase subunit SecA
MAGRGTDIELDPAARAAGGLHVLSCQHNASRRHDRQLAGRAGRHGDPGSTETWFVRRTSSSAGAATADNDSPWKHSNAFVRALRRAPWFRRWTQRREERRRAELRGQLLQQDLDWERRLSFAGPAG